MLIYRTICIVIVYSWDKKFGCHVSFHDFSYCLHMAYMTRSSVKFLGGQTWSLHTMHGGTCSLWDRANVYGNTKYIEGDVVTTGTPLSEPPLIDMMSNDPILCGVKVHICLLFSLLTFLLLDEKIHVILFSQLASFEQWLWEASWFNDSVTTQWIGCQSASSFQFTTKNLTTL